MKFEIYRDEKGEWRWRLKAMNGKIVAASGEGYKNKQDCVDAISIMRGGAPANAKVEDCSK